jgi:hypothetical protein
VSVLRGGAAHLSLDMIGGLTQATFVCKTAHMSGNTSMQQPKNYVRNYTADTQEANRHQRTILPTGELTSKVHYFSE